MKTEDINKLIENEEYLGISDIIYGEDRKDVGRLFLCIEECMRKSANIMFNPDTYTENDKYNTLSKLKMFCKIFSDDNRSIGTLMKHLNI